MIIAVNSTHFISLSGSNFFYNYLREFASCQPEHQFIFITATPPAKQQVFSKNISWVVSAPKAENALMWKLWLNYTLPAIARKHKASLLIHTGGVCSLRTRLQQSLFIGDLSFLSFPQYFSKSQVRFLKNNMPAFLNKAQLVVTASDFIAKELTGRYALENDKIRAAGLQAGKLYTPADWKTKEDVKDKFADGKEYFLFSGEIHPRHNLTNLLKAFSFFKKRQKSNMQLLIAVKNIAAGELFIESLKSYKYRDEVKLLTGLPKEEEANIMAAAYVFVYPSQYEGMGLPVMQAMQCGVPVITSSTGALPGITGNLALYVNPDSFEDIADKMMQVFKDETRRNELIELGGQQIEKLNQIKPYEWWAFFKG